MEPADLIGLMAAIIAAGQLSADGTPMEDSNLAQRAVSIAFRIALQTDRFRPPDEQMRFSMADLQPSNKGQ